MIPNRPVISSVVQYEDDLNTGKLTVLDLIGQLAGLGVDGIELRRELWPTYRSELSAVRDRIRAMGKLVTYATFSTLFSPDDAGHALLRHDLDTAQALGSPLLRIFPGVIPASATDPAWAEARATVEYAAAQGVAIALENFSRSPGGTSSEVLRVLSEIPSPALKTNIDVGNYAAQGEDVLAAIHALSDRIGYAHLKDRSDDPANPTTYLGDGALPLRAIVTALNALPQPIIYCFEFGGNDEPETRIAKSLAYLREMKA